MGYESTLIIVEHKNLKMNVEQKDEFYNPIIATFELCKMAWSPIIDKLFNEKLEGGIFYTNGNEEDTEDSYGEPLVCTGDFDVVIEELEEIERAEHYRRLPPIITMLKEFEKGIENGDWKNLKIVHYGH